MTTPDKMPENELSDGRAAVSPGSKPRYSVIRFLLGGTAAIALAAMIWPVLPRHYVSEATLIIQPSGVNNVENISTTLRQPLDESAILSELDLLRSDFLIDRLMEQHALLLDPEFSKPGIVTRLRVQIAELIAPDLAARAHVEAPGTQPSAGYVKHTEQITALQQRLLGISTAHAAAREAPPTLFDHGAEALFSRITVEPEIDSGPDPASSSGSMVADFRLQLAALVGPQELKPATHGEVRAQLRNAIDVHRDRRSYTLKIAVKSEDPVKATTLTQSFADAYLEMQVERKRDSFNHLTLNVRQRAETLGLKAQASRATIVEFMEQTGLVDEGAQASLNAQLTLLSTEAANAKAHAIEASSRANSLAEMQAQAVLDNAPAVLESPTVQRLKQNLAEALSRVAVSPVEIQSIEQRLMEEQDKIVAGAAIEAKNWTNRQEMLDIEIEHIRKQMVTRRIAALDLENLIREAESDEAAYRHALSELNNLASGEQVFLPDAELISAASTPTRAAFPNPLLFGIGALILALLSGAVFNFRAIIADIKKLAP